MLFVVFTRAGIILSLLVRAHKHKSLTTLGLAAAVVTGVLHSLTPSSLNLALLCAFFYTSTKFTKLKADVKKGITASPSNGNQNGANSTASSKNNRAKNKEGGDASDGGEGPRNHIQVLSNSVVASILCIFQLIWPKSNVLAFGVIAHYAAVTADTWSSELGILSTRQPVLITTLRPCPRGTNGGVSALGLYMGLAGGLFIGVVSMFAWPFALTLPVFDVLGLVLGCGLVGLFGTVLDSVLGATLQKSAVNRQGKIVEVPGGFKLPSAKDLKTYSGAADILDNNQVNLATAATTSLVAMTIWGLLMGW